jgi:hypothetical protein
MNTLRRFAWPDGWPWVVIPLLAIPALWPYSQGFPASADGSLHLLRLLLLDAHVRHGMLFPRWVPELVMGYGYPVFNFYGPSTFYLGELLRLLGAGQVQALMGTLALPVVLGGFGMYWLARDTFDPSAGAWPSLVAATAYMYAPYLLTNVFIRAAIGEVGAQALLPWIFWSFGRLLKHPRPRQYLLPAALTLGGLAGTHNITLLLLPPALLAYILVLWWRGGRDRQRLAWVTAGGLAAVAVGALFWLPLIGERQFLATTAYDVSRSFIPGNAWTLHNFLDTHLAFEYSVANPFQIGLVQLGLALAGIVALIVTRRSHAELWFWLGLVVVAGLGASAWTVPLWLSSDILLVVQFPWRLLSLISLALALLAGACLVPIKLGRPRTLVGLVLLAVIVAAHAPRLEPASIIHVTDEALDLAAVTQFEVETGGLGTSSAREFMPRWVLDMQLDPASYTPIQAGAAEVQMVAASAFERQLKVNASAGTELRFTDFYYPGWRARLDTGEFLPVYPTTNMGLLTVNVPAGAHSLRVYWSDTPLRQAANWISLGALATLVLVGLARADTRWAGVVAALLLGLAAAALLKPLPAASPVQAPLTPAARDGIDLLGYRLESTPGALHLYPYWYVAAPRPGVFPRWKLTGADGQVVSETNGRPYFNGSNSDQWPAGSVVDDAYRLSLPPGMAPGDYELWLSLSLEAEAEAAAGEPRLIARLSLPAVPAASPPAIARPLDTRFGQQITLAGYDLSVNGRPRSSGDELQTVRPNDLLEYTLYWRTQTALALNYHGLIHLVDPNGGVLVKRDQLAGAWHHYSSLWDPLRLVRDFYALHIPAGAAPGLYWPRVGLYDLRTIELLPVTNAVGDDLGDTLALSPIKVVRRDRPAPQHRISARFEATATLLGYDLELPPGGLHPGDSFPLTVYFQSDQTTRADYTRFVHVQSADQRMAGQVDSKPQQGLNPTWSWVPGEIIVDRMTVPLAPEAAPGVYALRVGLYDPGAEGARVTIFGPDGEPLPDATIVLTELQIEP